MFFDGSFTDELYEVLIDTYPGIDFLNRHQWENAIKHIQQLWAEGAAYQQRKEAIAARILFEKWGPYFPHLSRENQSMLVHTALVRASQRATVGDPSIRRIFFDHNGFPTFYTVNGVTYYHCGYEENGRLMFEPHWSVMPNDL